MGMCNIRCQASGLASTSTCKHQRHRHDDTACSPHWGSGQRFYSRPCTLNFIPIIPYLFSPLLYLPFCPWAMFHILRNFRMDHFCIYIWATCKYVPTDFVQLWWGNSKKGAYHHPLLSYSPQAKVGWSEGIWPTSRSGIGPMTRSFVSYIKGTNLFILIPWQRKQRRNGHQRSMTIIQ